MRMSPKSLVSELAEILILAVGLYLVITFAVQTVHVIGYSMVPTLDNNDYLIASKLDYRLHKPERGDIIILRSPFDQSKDFIKRIVALPGERLAIRNGQVLINGRALREDYLPKNEIWNVNANWPPDSPDGTVIPPDSYFVMGDNRNRSSDSRIFGPIKSDQIAGKAWIRVWPLDKFGVTGTRPELRTGLSGQSITA